MALLEQLAAFDAVIKRLIGLAPRGKAGLYFKHGGDAIGDCADFISKAVNVCLDQIRLCHSAFFRMPLDT